jgi:LDH2 family malate/lactate/ureidoglycolate dehydrogenase
MKGWGFYELQRQRAQEVMRASRPRPAEPVLAPGSVEREAAQAARNDGIRSNPLAAEGDDRL